MTSPTVWRTVVCRNPKPDAPVQQPPVMCGGGWWGEQTPTRCPRCKGRLTELAPTKVTDLEGAA